MHFRPGLQTAVLRLDGPPVAMAAQGHQLAVVWQAGVGAGQVARPCPEAQSPHALLRPNRIEPAPS